MKAKATKKIQVKLYNANYTSGVAFERQLKKLLEDKGHFVMRSAGSHGAADLIAIRNGTTYLIQCKPDPRTPKKEQEVLLAVCRKPLDMAKGLEYHTNLVPVQAYKWQRKITLLDMRYGTSLFEVMLS